MPSGHALPKYLAPVPGVTPTRSSAQTSAGYLLLHRFGGLFYADIDTDCPPPRSSPLSRRTDHLVRRAAPELDAPPRTFGMDRLLFNGTMQGRRSHSVILA